MCDYYAEFAGRLEMEGVQALVSGPVVVDEDTRHQVQYVPFEYVNPVAKLVIVGITPGNKPADPVGHLRQRVCSKEMRDVGCFHA